ncbi:hypothetical protein Q8F55_000795 [Vanrija albida]|uniref:Transmembrane protein 242 n=1 Tax=Vanrija albida TaxID=181172 RepID=A0ABR3QEA3_9TREE
MPAQPTAPPTTPTAQAPPGGAPTPSAPADSRLASTKTNLKYLALGGAAATAPASLTTRGVLTTLRYVLRYALRRLLRIALYGAVGSAIAVVGFGVLGSLGSGLAFFAAPGLMGSVAIGLGTGVVKFAWRHRPDKYRFPDGWWATMTRRAASGSDASKDEEADAVAEAANAELDRRNEDNRKTRHDVWMRV